MKLIYKILGTGLVAGALLLAGCAQESKSPPSIESASPDVQAKGALALAVAFNTELTLLTQTDPEVEGVTATFGTNTVTLDWDAFDDGEGDFITGQSTSTMVSNTRINTSGAVNVSGDITSELSFTAVDTPSKYSITMTIDGVKYSYVESGSSSKAPRGPAFPNKKLK